MQVVRRLGLGNDPLASFVCILETLLDEGLHREARWRWILDQRFAQYLLSEGVTYALSSK